MKRIRCDLNNSPGLIDLHQIMKILLDYESEVAVMKQSQAGDLLQFANFMKQRVNQILSAVHLALIQMQTEFLAHVMRKTNDMNKQVEKVQEENCKRLLSSKESHIDFRQQSSDTIRRKGQSRELKRTIKVAKENVLVAKQHLMVVSRKMANLTLKELIHQKKRPTNRFISVMKNDRSKESIGRGRFGEVVRFVNDGSCVAVKIFKPPFDINTRPDTVRALKCALHEANRLKCLDHPRIIKLYRGFVDKCNVRLYLFMEYATKGNLRNRILERGGRLEESESQKFAADILDGLIYLHSNRTIHRDLKPTNVLVSADDRAMLGDFGMARHKETPGISRDSAVGESLRYTAPEIFYDSGFSTATDMWAFGVTVLEMLTGEPLYPKMNDIDFRFTLQSSRSDNLNIPSFVSLLAKDFLKRVLVKKCSLRCTARDLKSDKFLTASLS